MQRRNPSNLTSSTTSTAGAERRRWSSVSSRSRGPHGSHPGRFRRLSLALAAYLLFASCMAATTAHVLHVRSQATAQPIGLPVADAPGQAKYLVLIVLDGARPDYFGLTPLPNMDALAASGTQFTNAFDGIL